MSNAYVNKVVINGVTKIDLTADTVSNNNIVSGTVAHTADGSMITGSNSAVVNTSSANASASDISSGKTAYVNGVKLTGTASGAVPTEISTDAEMQALAVASNLGKLYKFVGTTGTYIKNDLYCVEVPEVGTGYILRHYGAEWSTSTYSCQQVRKYTSDSSGTVNYEIVTGDVTVQSPYNTVSGRSLACLRFIPTRFSETLSVTISFKATKLQSWNGKFFAVAISESYPTSTLLSSTETPLNKPFAFGGSTYRTDTFSFTFTGEFEAGQCYYLLVAPCLTSYNVGALVNSDDVVLTAS